MAPFTRIRLAALFNLAGQPILDLTFDPADRARPAKPYLLWERPLRNSKVNGAAGKPSAGFDGRKPKNCIRHIRHTSARFGACWMW